MDWQQLIAVGVGGGLGAISRVLIGGWVAERWGTVFPVGTLLINVSGSFAIGVVLVLAGRPGVSPLVRLLLAGGFLGGYTTFSAFSYETLHLVETGEIVQAVGYVAASVLAGLLAVAAGVFLARLIIAT